MQRNQHANELIISLFFLSRLKRGDYFVRIDIKWVHRTLSTSKFYGQQDSVKLNSENCKICFCIFNILRLGVRDVDKTSTKRYWN